MGWIANSVERTICGYLGGEEWRKCIDEGDRRGKQQPRSPLQKSDRFWIVGAIDLILRQRQEGVLSSKGKWGGGGGERDHTINIERVVSVCKYATFWRLKKGFREESVPPPFLARWYSRKAILLPF